jgi:hypothetical protein
MSSVTVLGNGESRKLIDLNLFKEGYTLIGCNAVHRDVTVDHLVCCDHRMVREALKNTQTKNSTIYVRSNWHHYFRKILKNKNIKLLPTLPYQGSDRADRGEHWGSGPYAVLVAAALGFEQINLVGFDLYGINGKVNNMYKNTENYAVDSKQPVDHSYWVYQIAKVFELYPNINFCVYNRADWVMPDRWKRNNVEKYDIGLVSQLNTVYNNTQRP